MLGAAEVAALAHTDILNVHTWTTRGFADPYHSKPRARRGGGRARSYSVRDALRFFLMARLHKQFRTPLPQGQQICQSVFGEENFDRAKAAYLLVEEGASGTGEIGWFKDPDSLMRHLAHESVGMVINTKQILHEVESAVGRILAGER